MRPLLAAVSLLVLVACSGADAQEAPPSGGGSVRNYEVGRFDAVSLAGHHDVIVRVGPATSVRAEGPAEELDRLEIVEEDGRLKIGTKREWRRSGSSRPVKVYVTTPRLQRAAIAGSGDMHIDRVTGDSFRAAVSGSGDMEIASLEVGEADFSIAGSGNIRAAGAAARQTISIAGSGNVEADGLESRNAAVSIAGSGGVSARATEAASVSVMGSGNVRLQGGAECSVRKMGSGSVRCG